MRYSLEDYKCKEKCKLPKNLVIENECRDSCKDIKEFLMPIFKDIDDDNKEETSEYKCIPSCEESNKFYYETDRKCL